MAPIYLDFFTAPPKSKWVVIFTTTLIVEVLFMLRNFESHTSYQENLKLHLLLFWETDRGRVTDMEKSISKLYLLNLDPLLPIIKPLYSNTGCPAKNQLGIIRSLILMLDQKHHGITNWAKKVANDPLLCAICGFQYGKAPSVGSYYDFIKRLWKASHKIHVARKKKLRPFKPKPRKKLKAGQKLKPKHNGIVKKFARIAMRDALPEYRPEQIFQEFLARCVVDVSAKMGILGDVQKLSVAGDGTPFYSGASHYGTKVCDCKKHGVYDCKCPRRYSDPDARWGWDSYREQWFYGDTLFNITASDSPYDLPIYLRKAQASRHDSILAVFAMSEVRKLYPDLCIRNFIADGAMDNYPTYELMYHWNIIPFIPLDAKTKQTLTKLPPGIICLDDQGRPICKGGIPYEDCGYSYPKGIKYRCYFDCHDIEKPCQCTDSPYGRTVYLKPKDDFRLITPVPRGSEAFNEKFKTRTSVERSHKRLFEDYDIEEYKARSSRQRFALATFAAVNVHLDAWVKHTGFSIIPLLEELSGKAA